MSREQEARLREVAEYVTLRLLLTVPFLLLVLLAQTLVFVVTHGAVTLRLVFSWWLVSASERTLLENRRAAGASKMLMLLAAALACVSNVWLAVSASDSVQLGERLLLQLPESDDVGFWWCVLAVLFCDAAARQLCVACVCVLEVLAHSVGASTLRVQRLGLLVRTASFVFRMATPAPIWCGYFEALPVGEPLRFAFASLYLVWKSTFLFPAISRLANAASSALSCASPFGTYLSPEAAAAEAAESGAGDRACSICLGKWERPIQLSCRHIFCEACLANWFEAHTTCPMCRAQVLAAPVGVVGYPEERAGDALAQRQQQQPPQPQQGVAEAEAEAAGRSLLYSYSLGTFSLF
jgi:hypothetical protein